MSRRVTAELLGLITEARRRGEPFGRAWEPSVQSALQLIGTEEEAAEWRAVLHQTRRVWRAAYEGESVPGVDAFKALQDLTFV